MLAISMDSANISHPAAKELSRIKKMNSSQAIGTAKND
jgi:hypothetical protein